MSAESTESQSQSQEPDEKNVAAELPAPQADWFLELLVRMAHDDIENGVTLLVGGCLLYTSPSPRDRTRSRMPSSA